MSIRRFDGISRTLAGKGLIGTAVASAAAFAQRGFAAAQIDNDIASAGNGGVATASANGGAVSLGDINSGGNDGNAVAVGDNWSDVFVDGGSSSSSTNIGISANGGTAIADASGGDGNIAFVS